ncbi:MAG: hypothetical protein NTU85_00090 [Candidatus Kaiserbacteria bacterium]|nr:hypothetical protein [Candidatus Kaiserbacteria bacterium]
MRRYLTIAAIVIVIIGIGVAAYFYFFANKASIAVIPTGSINLPSAGLGAIATTTNSSAEPSTPIQISTRLMKISAGPVVLGEAVVDIPARDASSSPDVAVNYIERQSGNVFSYLTHTGMLTRTSNKTIPGIQSAAWLPDASVAFVRYLSGDNFSTINTYALPSVSSAISSGFFLPQNLSDIRVSSTSVLILASGVNGSVASTVHLDGTRTSAVFSTPLSSLRISFAGKNQYLAYTKPSVSLSGSAFLVNSSGHFSRIAGPLNGLIALASHSGKWTLISYTLNNAMQLELVDTTNGSVVPLPVATIADKCVWTADDSSVYCGIPMNPPSDSAYPDDWYQGVVQFSDRIWKIDVSGRFAQLVLDFPSETKTSLDAEALAIDPLNTTLVFVNKNDLSLWSYQL